MKKFKKIMAVLVAAMMIMATMVPAWASIVSDKGRMDVTDSTATVGTESKYGTITVANAKAGETYTAYRIFDLASFTDDDIATGSHADKTEAYSYVISEDSPWWTWFKSQAVLTTATTDSSKYFTYEKEKVTLKDSFGVKHEDYHVVYANPANTDFVNDNDDTTTNNYRTGTEANQDAAGTPKGPDYLTDSNKAIQAFAKLAAAEAAKTPATYKKSNWSYSSTAASDGSMTVPTDNSGKIPLGYYLVSTTMGTLAILDTTNKNVTVYEKNDEPAITKYVSATGEDGSWVSNLNADIADTVYFKTTITAQQGAKDYTLHDVMEDGFVAYTADDITNRTFIESVTLTRTATSTTYDLVPIYDKGTPADNSDDVTNWTLTNPPTDSGCRFEIAFEDTFFGRTGAGEEGDPYVFTEIDIKDGDIITVIYTATVDTDAVLFGTAETKVTKANVKTNGPTATVINAEVYKDHNEDGRNTNSTILTYGAQSYTSWAVATVTTYQFDIVKIKTEANSKNDTSSTNYFDLLDGAEFSLYKATTTAPDANGPNGLYDPGATSPTDSGYYKTYTIGTNTYYILSDPLLFSSTSEYMYAGDMATKTAATNGSVPANHTTTLLSKNNSEIHVYGVEAGTYILIEDKAPTGYNKLANPIAITISDGTLEDASNNTVSEGEFLSVFADNNGNTPVTSQNKWNATVNASTTEGYPSYYNSNLANNGGLKIINTTGEELPSTGGMGTTVLYIVGGMMVILAGAYLFFSKKRNAA